MREVWFLSKNPIILIILFYFLSVMGWLLSFFCIFYLFYETLSPLLTFTVVKYFFFYEFWVFVIYKFGDFFEYFVKPKLILLVDFDLTVRLNLSLSIIQFSAIVVNFKVVEKFFFLINSWLNFLYFKIASYRFKLFWLLSFTKLRERFIMLFPVIFVSDNLAPWLWMFCVNLKPISSFASFEFYSYRFYLSFATFL